ncbi:hypothetical protein [Spirosoma agri]|uniref:Uncharacterized protein n=1 Tax=Spirosoma agri TaxID=1987381 RepID=A0A6M0IQU3_9BACT|nr:hypothetical protein [Spirosoma agri]NEU70710.1 hypothetical protein [Spirosoma agri]
MNIWRIAGVALVAGLALFLVTILIKLLLVAAATFVLVRVVGRQLARRAFGPLERGNWQSAEIIAIDQPTFQAPMHRPRFDRVISIS